MGKRRGIQDLSRSAGRVVAAAGLAVSLAAITGCGSTYRPVVSAIGVVGPAAQPTKYAIAISSASSASNGLMTMVDFSGDTVMVTATLGVNPYYLALNSGGTRGYTLNSDKTLTSFAISTSLISSQVQESTLPTGSNPVSIFEASSTYVTDTGDNAIDQMIGTPPALQQELSVGAGFTPVYVVGQASASRYYAISQSTNAGLPGQVSAIESMNNTISTTLPVGVKPVYGVMTIDGRRAFILNQTDGTVSVVNAQTNALDQFPDSLNTFKITGFSIANNVATFTAANTLKAGMNVLIQGLSTGTYLNGQTLTVLSSSSTQFTAAFTNANVASTVDAGTAAELTSTIPVGSKPVWADLAPAVNELVVANEGDGTNPGSVSFVNIPLCTSTTLVSNSNCDSNNPIDATSFGQVIKTIPVGVNPIMVSVLSDDTRAYVANAGNPNLPCAATASATTTTCTISVVNLTTNTVTATIPINGHPAYIATSNATPTGKVYVVCKDSQVMTVIETDTDSIDTTIPLQGYGVSVRMTAQ